MLLTFLAIISANYKNYRRNVIDMPAFFVALRTYKRYLARGPTKIKSCSLVVNHAQKVNNILYYFNKIVKILPQHTEIKTKS